MIEVNDLQKSFEDIRAIDHITARIEDGHVFGLIGTNGAGKCNSSPKGPDDLFWPP